MGLFESLKMKLELNKTFKLNRPIEVLSDEELFFELEKRMKEINKSKIIDQRTKDIIISMLERDSKMVDSKYIMLWFVYSLAKDPEVKNKILEEFGNYLNVEEIPRFLRTIQQRGYFEIQDDIKIKILGNIQKIKSRDRNYVNFNDINLYKEKEQELLKNLENYEKILYNKNFDKFDFVSLIKTKGYDFVEEVYGKVSQENKITLLSELIDRGEIKKFNINTKKYDKLINQIPNDVLKEIILSKPNIDFFRLPDFLKDKVQITTKDVKNYYRKYGVLKFTSVLYEEDLTYTADELIKELDYLKDEEDKRRLANIYIREMEKEEQEKFFLDENIDEESRIEILNNLFNEGMYEEQIEFFNKLNQNMKNKTFKYFALNKINNSEDKLDKDEYIKTILSQITDEKYYKKYVLSFFISMQFDPQQASEILIEDPNQLTDIQHNSKTFLNFTDEQIKKIYEKAPVELQEELISITRRKQYSPYAALFSVGEGKTKTKEEIEEYNKDKSKFILVNEDNYYDLLINSNYKISKRLLYEGEFREYLELLTEEQSSNILKKLLDENEGDSYEIGILEGKFLGKLTYDDIIDKLLEFDNKKMYEEILSSYIFYKKLPQNNKKEMLDKLCNIKNKDIKIKYIDFVIDHYDTDKNNENNPIDLLEEEIKDENISIEDKYIFLSQYFKCIRTYDNNYQKYKDKGIELYKYVNSLANKEKYNEFIKNETFFTMNYSLISYLSEDKVYKILCDLYKNNENVISTISSVYFQDNLIDKFDYELFEFYSRYGTLSSFQESLNDEKRLEIIINSYDRLKDFKAYPEEDLEDILKLIQYKKIKEFENIDFSKTENIDKLIAISKTKNSKNVKFEEFEEQIKQQTRETIESTLSTREQLIDALGRRFFNTSYEEMNNYVEKYYIDAHIFIEQYEKKENLTQEEQNELNALKIIRNFKEIINIKDKEAIIEIFKEKDKDEKYDKIDYASMIALNENAKRVYAKDYLKDLYVPKEADKKIIDGIEVFSPKEFNMIVHNIGAFSHFKLVNEENLEVSAEENWENKKNRQSHILCTSYVRNSNFSYASKYKKNQNIIDKLKNFIKHEKEEEQQDVLLGFCDIDVNAIPMANISDLSSETSELSSQKAYSNFSFRSADNLSNMTRIKYNEVDVERRLKEDKLNNIKPSYVIAVDEITSYDKKIAEDFNIPIVYINQQELAKQEAQKLKANIEQYKDTKETELLENIITQYMNNLTSFSVRRKDLIEKYFNKEEMKNEIKNILSNLVKEYKFGKKDVAISGVKSLYNAFNKECEILDWAGIMPKYPSYVDFNVREYAYNLKGMLEKMDNSQLQQNTNKDIINIYQKEDVKKLDKTKGDEVIEK